MLLVCTPISGGHFNPALTLSVFLTCPNKRDKISKLLMMIAAQFLGGLIGLALAQLFRVDVKNDPALAQHDFYPAYTPSQSAIESVAPGTDIAPVLLFAEVFASLLLCLVFLSLKYRKDLTDNGRDPVFGAAALALTLFVVCSVTGLIIGDSMINPVVAFIEILQYVIFFYKPLAGGNVISVGGNIIRCVGPFIGSILAALVFSYQLEVLEDIQKENFNARASQVLKQENMIKDLLIE